MSKPKQTCAVFTSPRAAHAHLEHLEVLLHAVAVEGWGEDATQDKRHGAQHKHALWNVLQGYSVYVSFTVSVFAGVCRCISREGVCLGFFAPAWRLRGGRRFGRLGSFVQQAINLQNSSSTVR